MSITFAPRILSYHPLSFLGCLGYVLGALYSFLAPTRSSPMAGVGMIIGSWLAPLSKNHPAPIFQGTKMECEYTCNI